MTAGAPHDLVAFRMDGHIGIITLADHARRNALSGALVSGVLAAMEASKLAQARALVICSSAPAFCAGADIKEMIEGGWLEQKPTPGHPSPLDLFERIESDPRPCVAAIDGLALGGGVELSIACDFVVAGEGATFAFPEVGLGVIPNTAMARLPGLIGRRAALDLILTRRRISASEAQSLGLVNRVVESEGDVLSQAIAFARSIVDACPPTALGAVKKGIAGGMDWAAIRNLMGTMDSAEWEEGFAAFLERRKPAYDRFWTQG